MIGIHPALLCFFNFLKLRAFLCFRESIVQNVELDLMAASRSPAHVARPDCVAHNIVQPARENDVLPPPGVQDVVSEKAKTQAPAGDRERGGENGPVGKGEAARADVRTDTATLAPPTPPH